VAVKGTFKKNKLEANMLKRLERGAKKAKSKALRAERKFKEKNV
jgi:hypothetical protein